MSHKFKIVFGQWTDVNMEILEEDPVLQISTYNSPSFLNLKNSEIIFKAWRF